MRQPQGVSREQLELIVNLIKGMLPKVRIFAFGSRLEGKHRPYSDFDLALDDQRPIPLNQLSQLKERIASSILPFTVDLVDYSQVNQEFKAIIDKQHINLT